MHITSLPSLFICLYIQSYRKDKSFVYCHIQKPHSENVFGISCTHISLCCHQFIYDQLICYPVLVAAFACLFLFKVYCKTKTYFKNYFSDYSRFRF